MVATIAGDTKTVKTTDFKIINTRTNATVPVKSVSIDKKDNCIKKRWTFDEENYVFCLILGYDFFVILSTIESKYRTVAVHGASEQYESMFVLIAYSIVCMYSYYAVTALNENQTLSDKFYRLIVPLCLVPVLFILVPYRNWICNQ